MEQETVSIILPTPPDTADWGRDNSLSFRYQISWIDSSGKLCRAETDSDRFTLVLEKNRITPILAEPILSNGEESFSFFHPAGGLYPVHLSPGKELSLGWRLGVEAALVRRMLLSTDEFRDARKYLAHFNWEKLESYLARHENPWVINTTLIAESIASGAFSARNIKALPLNTIQITPSGEPPVLYDPYVPAAPYLPDAEELSSFTVSVQEGVSQFLANDGILTLSVTGKKASDIHFAPFKRK
jgi:hypothetical protein